MKFGIEPWSNDPDYFARQIEERRKQQNKSSMPEINTEWEALSQALKLLHQFQYKHTMDKTYKAFSPECRESLNRHFNAIIDDLETKIVQADHNPNAEKLS